MFGDLATTVNDFVGAAVAAAAVAVADGAVAVAFEDDDDALLGHRRSMVVVHCAIDLVVLHRR